MEYKSNRIGPKLVGVLFIFIGGFTLFLAYVAKGEANVLWFLGLPFLFLSVSVFTYQCSVKIDTSNQMVYKSLYMWPSTKTVSYFFSDFSKVEILSGGGQHQAGGPYINYLVHLTGTANICVAGMCQNLENAVMKGKEIAQAMNLPLEEQPKVGFILNLWERLT